MSQKIQKRNSDRGNRTPGCRVRDDDVSHYTISDVVVKEWHQSGTIKEVKIFSMFGGSDGSKSCPSLARA